MGYDPYLCRGDGLLCSWLNDCFRKSEVWYTTLPLMDCTESARCDHMFMAGYPDSSEPHLKANWL